MSNSSVDLIDLIKRIIAPLFLLLGVVLIIGGILNAMFSITTYPSDSQTVTVYPRLYVGSVIAIIGLVVSVFSYLIIHNKIGIAKYFK